MEGKKVTRTTMGMKTDTDSNKWTSAHSSNSHSQSCTSQDPLSDCHSHLLPPLIIFGGNASNRDIISSRLLHEEKKGYVLILGNRKVLLIATKLDLSRLDLSQERTNKKKRKFSQIKIRAFILPFPRQLEIAYYIKENNQEKAWTHFHFTFILGA